MGSEAEGPQGDPAASTRRFRPEGVVFDMDGLLVDSEPIWFEVECEFAAARGHGWSHAHAERCVGHGMDHTLRYMANAFGFSLVMADAAREMLASFEAKIPLLVLKPGASELVEACKASARIAVASSSPLPLIRRVLDRFDLTGRFDAIVSGEDVPRPKPAPDVFLKAAAEIGVDPARCAALEDSLTGATAARAAGMFTIAVPERGDPAGVFARVADRVVPSLSEARAWIVLGE